jgi:AAA domain
MAFMADFEYARTAKHPYNWGPDSPHGHFAPTQLRHPKYSAAAVPFSWLLRENMESLGEEYGLEVQLEAEPDLGFKTEWVQEQANQRALLDCFAGHIKPEKSLCFFYAKQVPLVEENKQRVLIGVGRVQHVSPCVEYEYAGKNLSGKLRSVLWELMVQHSIRPSYADGFLLPYHSALELAKQDPSFDPGTIVAFTPEDRLVEFSFGSQLVTHDAAIAALLACAEALRTAEPRIVGPWAQCLKWINERMSEVWIARGPFPGLSAALNAFGLEQGTFVAHSIMQKVADNGDPWPIVESLFDDPEKNLSPMLSKGIGKTICEKWKKLPSARKALLKLLSRFELSNEQAETLYIQEVRAKAGLEVSDDRILDNPYVLYEITRLESDPISASTIDRGVFPNEIVRERHPLPKPSALDSATGKTTLLSVLCAESQIADDGILLLAPTGKARVRMEHSTRKLNLKGLTIAQFLSPHRYSSKTGRYRLSDKPIDPGVRTVVIDEASMLTEEMLAATIEALRGVHRLLARAQEPVQGDCGLFGRA